MGRTDVGKIRVGRTGVVARKNRRRIGGVGCAWAYKERCDKDRCARMGICVG